MNIAVHFCGVLLRAGYCCKIKQKVENCGPRKGWLWKLSKSRGCTIARVHGWFFKMTAPNPSLAFVKWMYKWPEEDIVFRVCHQIRICPIWIYSLWFRFAVWKPPNSRPQALSIALKPNSQPGNFVLYLSTLLHHWRMFTLSINVNKPHSNLNQPALRGPLFVYVESTETLQIFAPSPNELIETRDSSISNQLSSIQIKSLILNHNFNQHPRIWIPSFWLWCEGGWYEGGWWSVTRRHCLLRGMIYCQLSFCLLLRSV